MDRQERHRLISQVQDDDRAQCFCHGRIRQLIRGRLALNPNLRDPRAGHHAGVGPRPEAVQVGDLVLAADHEERVLEDCVRREVLIHCSFGFGGVPTQQAGQEFFVEFLFVEALHSLRVLWLLLRLFLL